MDKYSWQQIEQLFSEAIELPPDEREAFVERVCGDSAAAKSDLLSLLHAHAREDGPLDRRPPLPAVPSAASDLLAAGTRLGRWRIGELIGYGGAGEVYAAARVDGQYEQKVAIKVLRHESIGEAKRFLAERHILARLEHPGIARLLDGGVLQDERPYAVIEYIEGRPLIEHCTAHGDGLQRRLQLFNEACDAVSYAHRNLIVHRDLKPANILVGAEGHVKLLDFGIAKHLSDSLAGELTRAPMTPEYAAPEQLTGEPITTATDVYALGVILFELLTGERPWRCDGMPLARAIQLLAKEPAPPASRVAKARADAPVAMRRITGDLDAIVAKCLHKEPEHRYETVDALQQDLARLARHEPVLARERAWRYMLGRFLRRNRWAVSGVFVVFLALIGALGVTLWQVSRVALERDIARRVAEREEAVRYYLTSMFRSSLAESHGEPMTAKAMLDRSARRVLETYRDEPRLAGKIVETLADLYGALEDVEGQVPLLEGFLAGAGAGADPEAVALARQKLANIELLRGHAERAGELLALAEEFWDMAPQRYREQRLEGMFYRGALLRAQGDLAGSINTYKTAIEGRTALSGHVHRETANLYNSLAISLTGAGRMDEALAAYRESIGIHESLGQGDDLDALVMLGNTGTLAYRTGRMREAQSILKTAFTKQQQLAGDSAAVAASMGLYGATLTAQGHAEEAVGVLRTAANMAVQFTGPGSPLSIQDRLFLVDALRSANERDAAFALFAETLAAARDKFGDSHILTLRAQLSGARLVLADGNLADAEMQLAGVIESLRAIGPPAELQLAQALVSYGDALLAQSRDATTPLLEALALREKLLWSDGWEIAEARARLGEALLPGRDARAAGLLQQAVVALQAELGAGHAQTLRALRALDRL